MFKNSWLFSNTSFISLPFYEMVAEKEKEV